jgi:hypothetical protein
MAVLRVDDKPRGRDEIAVSPTLDVAETDKFLTVQRHDGLATGHFCGDVFGRTLGDARATLQRRLVDQIADTLGVVRV